MQIISAAVIYKCKTYTGKDYYCCFNSLGAKEKVYIDYLMESAAYKISQGYMTDNGVFVNAKKLANMMGENSVPLYLVLNKILEDLTIYWEECI